MTRSALIAGLIALLAACGGEDFKSADEIGGSGAGQSSSGASGSAGGGGSNSGAGGGGRGGSGGALAGAGGIAFGGSGNCQQLWMNYQSEFEQARQCNPDAMNQCQATLRDGCGCDVPVNGTTGHYTSAQQRYGDFMAGGCTLLPCVIPCMPSMNASCRSSMSGGGNVCG